MHVSQNSDPELSVTDDRRRTDDGRTGKLEGSLHNRPFGQLSVHRATLLGYTATEEKTIESDDR